MDARRISPRTRFTLAALAVCLAFVVVTATSSSARAEQEETLPTIDLCITRSGPDKGTVRFIYAKLACRLGEQRVRLVGSSDQPDPRGSRGMLSSTVLAGPVGLEGPKGDRGERGPRGIQGEKGERGARGPEGQEGQPGTPGIDGATRMLVSGLATSSAASNVAPTFLGPFPGDSSTSIEEEAQQVLPVGGAVANLFVDLAEPPGAERGWSFVIRRQSGDGGTQSTAVRCQISGAEATACNSGSASAAFAAGDLLSLEVSPAGEPDAWVSARWSVSLTE